jgi:hypothetical protein
MLVGVQEDGVYRSRPVRSDFTTPCIGPGIEDLVSWGRRNFTSATAVSDDKPTLVERSMHEYLDTVGAGRPGAGRR